MDNVQKEIVYFFDIKAQVYIDQKRVEYSIASFLSFGYDPEKPIIVSKHETDPSLNGIMIDGHHRSVAIQLLFERGIKIEPVVKTELVTNSDEILERRRFYNTNRLGGMTC